LRVRAQFLGKFKEVIDRDINEGMLAGITGTPTLFINGQRLEGAKSLQSFVQLIDEELAQAVAKKAVEAVR